MKKIYIETMGCPKNSVDSEKAAGILKAAGHEIIDDPSQADVLMVNTCGFIDDAKKESIAAIFDLAEYRQQKGRMLVVTGCLSQRYGDALFEEMPEADAMLGVNDYERLPQLVENFFAAASGARSLHVSGFEPAAPAQENGLRIRLSPRGSAPLKIAEGCDNCCTYCIIPAIRGPYRSRSMEEIVREAEALAAAGAKELILIAQDVTAYGSDRCPDQPGGALPELIRRLCRISGIGWIRLMYCYEDRITDELIAIMREEEKVCHYIDIPLQHISRRILSAMNRHSTPESIRDTIRRLRQAMPDIAIRTTFIVGFPGETEADFEELLDFAEETGFDRLGAFAYSREEGTPAAEMPDQVVEEEKQARLDALLQLQLNISLAKNQEKIGRVFEVLVEEREEDGAFFGRTRYDAPEIDNGVIFTSDADPAPAPGDLVRIRIEDAFDYDLTGVHVTEEECL